MNDLAYLDPPVEVLAESPRLEMIMSRLRSGRMRPFRADIPISCNSSEALLVDIKSLDRETLDPLLERAGTFQRPILVLGDAEMSVHFPNALLVARDRDISVLRGRLDVLRRRSVRLSEMHLRRESAACFGVNLPAPCVETVPDLLYLGDGSSRFLALQAALGERGITVTAAFSTHTAADYMKQKAFTAILVDVTPETRHPDKLAKWLSASLPCFEDTPLFGLMETTSDHSALASFMAHVFEPATPVRALATHIETHGRRHAQRLPYTEGEVDLSPITHSETGLYSQTFLEAHLQRQIEQSVVRGEPLTVMVICDPSRESLDAADKNCISDLILSGLRETDLPAFIEADTFAISLPATSYKGATQLCERLFRTLEQSASRLKTHLGWRIIEKRAHHDAVTLLKDATSGVFQKSRTG